jgi:hypothetical protein
VEKQLFACSEYKFTATINTLQISIRKFHVWLPCALRTGSRVKNGGLEGAWVTTTNSRRGPSHTTKVLANAQPAKTTNKLEGFTPGIGDDLNLAISLMGLSSQPAIAPMHN